MRIPFLYGVPQVTNPLYVPLDLWCRRSTHSRHASGTPPPVPTHLSLPAVPSPCSHCTRTRRPVGIEPVLRRSCRCREDKGCGEEGGIDLQEQTNTGLVLGEQENGAMRGPAGDRHLKRPIEYHPPFVQKCPFLLLYQEGVDIEKRTVLDQERPLRDAGGCRLSKPEFPVLY
jgi:hypothetical protein